MNENKKVALIIGAGDATGGAIARRFAREGMSPASPGAVSINYNRCWKKSVARAAKRMALLPMRDVRSRWLNWSRASSVTSGRSR